MIEGRATFTNANNIIAHEIEILLLTSINAPINMFSLHEENRLLTGLLNRRLPLVSQRKRCPTD